MNITAFPYDLFLLIVAHLSPSDLVLARRVSKAFHLAFTDSQLCLHLLQQHYPRVREVRDVANEQGEDWSRVFSRVAARYHYLKLGKPRSVEKFALGKSFVVPKWARYYPVSTWHQLLKFEEKAAPFHYPDPLWTYSDGVLVFPSIDAQKYMLYDLSNGSLGEFDFQPESKIVRRIRLKDNVLVVEWCEQEAYHQLNESEMVYRHFATAYNLTQNVQNGKWEAVFRNEWKIHFLGMPLNSRDRFYSTHTSSHYALYLWQPNRSAWGEDDPIEALAVWDISSPSDYRPSEDPTGRGNYITDSDGPKVIRRFSFADMDFYRIRQRSTPTLRALELDENHVYFIEEDHRWLVGPEAAHNHARLHKVKSVGIPFAAGPHWMDECGANGDANISYCERDLNNRHPRFAPCWRHEEFPYLTTSEALDPKAGVKFSARHCFLLETISINVKSKIDMVGPGYEAALMDDMWPQLLNKGKICGDERWLIGENSSQEVVVLRFDEEPLKRR